MKKITIAINSYASLILIGGLIGFFKAASLPSLVMSSLFAFLLIMSSVVMNRHFKMGFYTVFSSSVFLSLFFAYRLITVQKFMPSGLMLILSLAMVNFLYFKIRQDKSLKIKNI